MSWLKEFLEVTDFVETPKQWLLWSGLCAISAVAAPNISVKKRAYNLRPNLYVLLTGRSGLGKGFGPSMARRLVKAVGNTRVISGRGTIEGIISELANFKAGSDGKLPFKDARGFISSGEFAASLYDSKSALTILTDLYDAHDNPEWVNTLKNSPVEKLIRPCITLLSGANQDMFDMAIDKHHIGGGFVGRTLLIGADKRSKSNSLIRDEGTEITDETIQHLAKHLKDIAKLSGQMTWSEDAMDAYDSWFYPYRESEVEDKTGTFDRLNDHIIKVATCISLSRKLDMQIEEDDITTAIELCSSVVGTAKRVAGMTGKSSLSSQIKSFLILLFSSEKYIIGRKKVLQRGFGDFDSAELDKVVETLNQTGLITSKTTAKDTFYHATEVGVRWWEAQTQKGED